jgi:transcriptional regulator with XRE-family HTH domain
MIPGNDITGKMICHLRMAKGLAQKELAAKLKISQQAYSKIENNGIIKYTLLIAILTAMNSSMDELSIVNILQSK